MRDTAPPVEDASENSARPRSLFPPVIEANGVGFSAGEVVILHDIQMAVEPGEIFGLIGPSGCGKSTLLRLVGGIGRPTEGDLFVLGKPPAELGPEGRKQIGYVPQSFALYDNLSIEQNARFVAGLYGLGWRHRRRRIRELLELFELWPMRKRLAKNISGGMKQRVSLACAMLHEPSLLLIDEPTAGLDPLLRNTVWEYLRELRDAQTTIFVTTQYIDEATHCDRIAIMRSGSIIRTGEPEELRRQTGGGEALEVVAHGLRQEHVTRLWEARAVNRVDWDGSDQLRIATEDSAIATPEVTEILNAAGVEIQEIRPFVPSFEDAFVELVKSKRNLP